MRIVLALLLFLAPMCGALAGVERVDDSASSVLTPRVNMKWDTAAPVRGQRDTLTGQMGVEVRLDTRKWVGKMAKIYMTLPIQAVGPVQVKWSTRGRFLPGMLQAGNRGLVYAGMIDAPMMEDTMVLLIQADGDRLSDNEQMQFSFEIETQE